MINNDKVEGAVNEGAVEEDFIGPMPVFCNDILPTSYNDLSKFETNMVTSMIDTTLMSIEADSVSYETNDDVAEEKESNDVEVETEPDVKTDTEVDIKEEIEKPEPEPEPEPEIEVEEESEPDVEVDEPEPEPDVEEEPEPEPEPEPDVEEELEPEPEPDVEEEPEPEPETPQTQFLLTINAPDSLYSSYPIYLSDYDRETLAHLVMGEFGTGGFTGCALIAQCVRDAMVRFGYGSVNEVIAGMNYVGWYSGQPSSHVYEAISYIFDQGNAAVQHEVLVMYAANIMYSGWHESQQFVVQYGNVRFFDYW